LTVGDCYVPYLLYHLKGKGHNIKGELWRINKETLYNLDEYEGVDKDYYKRELIEIILQNEKDNENENENADNNEHNNENKNEKKKKWKNGKSFSLCLFKI